MADEIQGTGLHPRVVKGHTVFEKVNTCANSSLTKRLTRQLAGIEKHLETNPRDGLSQQRVATIKSILNGTQIVRTKAA